jgi:integrase
MVRLIPAPVVSPAFVYTRESNLVPLTKVFFVRKFRELLARAQVPNAALYTGHSFRRGGATYAFRIGISGEVIQLMGDWKSDAYKRYIEFDFDTMLSVSRQMRDAVK